MSIETGGPAFPHPAGWRRDPHISDGMTLRDYFAAKAMQAMIPIVMADHNYPNLAQSVAKTAYHIANEMLKARGQE